MSFSLLPELAAATDIRLRYSRSPATRARAGLTSGFLRAREGIAVPPAPRYSAVVWKAASRPRTSSFRPRLHRWGHFLRAAPGLVEQVRCEI
jgi:hypothetical protein